MPDAWPLERDPYLLETSVPGIFAAGDVRHGSIKRVASGVGEGSIAIALVHEHLAELAERERERAGSGEASDRASSRDVTTAPSSAAGSTSRGRAPRVAMSAASAP